MPRQVWHQRHLKKQKIKLTNVARASLEELMIDYEDYLRIHHLEKWSRSHAYSLRFDQLSQTPNATYQTFKKAIEHENPEISANFLRCLINVTSFLLGKQLKALEIAFINEGGLRERMTKARLKKRNKM